MLGRAAAFIFGHGAEGGDGRQRHCEGSAQASPPLPFLGGEKGERAVGTAAALAGPGAAVPGVSWNPIGCGPLKGGERAARWG